MPNRKRALATWLGLLLCLHLPLGAEEDTLSIYWEVSTRVGTLWVEDDGAALYWQGGLAFNLGHSLFLGFDLVNVYANLPWLDVCAFGLRGRFGVDTPAGGFVFTGGFFDHSQLRVGGGMFSVSNEGGRGSFVGVELPVRLGPFTVTPQFLHAEATWGEGDMYWFFCKPVIPSIFLYGLSLEFDWQGRYRHGLDFRHFSLDLDIVSNDYAPLFGARLDTYLLFYGFSLERSRSNFSGTLGWLYANARLEGALTSANQPFFLFPFIFFEVDAGINAHAGFALFNFQRSHGIFRHNINMGVIHFFHDRTGVNTNYRMKNLFGGSEGGHEINLDIAGLGAAILAFEAALPSVQIARGKRLFLGLEKIFAVPWGFGNLIASSTIGRPDGGPSLSGVDIASVLRTVLLSGLSLQVSLSW